MRVGGDHLTVGLIGCGRFAPLHLDALLRNDRARRVIAADPDVRALHALHRRYGIIKRVETDWRAVVESPEVDIVDILTPHDSHCEIALAALQAGKHVICEKPIARTLEEADAMIAAAQQAGRRLLVSLPQVHLPAVVRARQMMEAGEIGRPFLAVMQVYDDEVARMSDPEHWKGDLERAGGGVLIDAGYHPTYLLLHLFGRPRAVTALCRRLVIATEGKGEDTASVALDLGEGVMGVIVVTFADHATRHRSERRIVGTAGTLLIRDTPEDEMPLLLLVEDDTSAIPVHNPLEVAPYALEATLNDLIGAIVEDREPLASTQLARDTLATVLAAYQSEREGRQVELVW
ncbi:MAG: Gfo/Idh/MocA family protein [Armatimonadota bacterium]